jgi:hypothetical protein
VMQVVASAWSDNFWLMARRTAGTEGRS